jgi:hypothetical protein
MLNGGGFFTEYFRHPDRFEDPVQDLAELQRIRNSAEYERKASVPIKAALKDAGCSRFQASSPARYCITRFLDYFCSYKTISVLFI